MNNQVSSYCVKVERLLEEALLSERSGVSPDTRLRMAAVYAELAKAIATQALADGVEAVRIALGDLARQGEEAVNGVLSEVPD